MTWNGTYHDTPTDTRSDAHGFTYQRLNLTPRSAWPAAADGALARLGHSGEFTADDMVFARDHARTAGGPSLAAEIEASVRWINSLPVEQTPTITDYPGKPSNDQAFARCCAFGITTTATKRTIVPGKQETEYNFFVTRYLQNK